MKKRSGFKVWSWTAPRRVRRSKSHIDVSGVKIMGKGKYLLLYEEKILARGLGDGHGLGDFFQWSRSPQGYDYWRCRSHGLEKLSEEDYLFLEALLEKAKELNYEEEAGV